MNSPYSIWVLRGTEIRRIELTPKRLRRAAMLGLTALSLCGLLLNAFLAAQQKKIEAIAASALIQKDQLAVLHDQAKAAQETLSRWKGLRQKIYAALPQRNQPAASGTRELKDGEVLQLRLAAIDSELKRLIAALPSEWPVQGAVSSGVGLRPSPWTGEMEYHSGLDIPKPIGTPVHASGDAVVESTDGRNGTVVLNHGQEIKTSYSHLSKIHVAAKTPVRKGQVIAEVGNTGKSTGPHLHYEVRVAGVAIDPRPSLPSSKSANSGNAVGGGVGSSN